LANGSFAPVNGAAPTPHPSPRDRRPSASPEISDFWLADESFALVDGREASTATAPRPPVARDVSPSVGERAREGRGSEATESAGEVCGLCGAVAVTSGLAYSAVLFVAEAANSVYPPRIRRTLEHRT